MGFPIIGCDLGQLFFFLYRLSGRIFFYPIFNHIIVPIHILYTQEFEVSLECLGPRKFHLSSLTPYLFLRLPGHEITSHCPRRTNFIKTQQPKKFLFIIFN